jgi:hypothetical protein
VPFPINFYIHKKLDMAAKLAWAAGSKVVTAGSKAYGGIKEYGTSFGAGLWAYYTNPVWIAMQLVQWGASRAEAKRLMELVTEPRRGSDGTLLVKPGEFPFPRGLYEAISRPEKLKTKKMKILYASMRPNDVIIFEYLYIPIKYATLSRANRKNASIEMTNMKIKSFDKPIVEKRLSVHDLRDPYLVTLAIRVNGSKNSPRTKEWVDLYGMYKGFKCIAIASNNKRNACLESHNAMVKKRKLDHAKRMIEMRRLRSLRSPGTPKAIRNHNRQVKQGWSRIESPGTPTQ